MNPVEVVRGKAIPLDRRDVDTDQIIPARHLKRVERTGYGEFAFEAWRKDEDFVLNDPAHEDAVIMLTRQNFGSGSSREHAVWALTGLGIRALVGSGFADIFKNNCVQSGVTTVELADEDIDFLMSLCRNDPDTVFEVDLAQQTVSVPSVEWTRQFEVAEDLKHRLLNGLDDISLTLETESEIKAFEGARKPWMPKLA